jgi:predicted negative regulator of RcsB-dependent stress response
MATASKRFSRKALRQPDWFQVNSEKALDFIAEHRTGAIGVGIAIALLAIAVWAWQGFKENQNIAAAQEYAKAVNLYQGEKYREAIPEFEKVQTYRWSRYASLAHIYLANSYLAINEIDKALAEAQRSVPATKPNSLYRQIALFVLGTAEERKDQCKSAMEHYAEAQKIIAALQESAALGRARCAERLGDLAAAITTYKEYVKENPGSPFVVKLAELEAKVAAQAKAK